jgi:hypothetical protein
VYAQEFDGLAASGSATLTGRGPHALEGVLGSSGVPGWYGANFAGSSSNTEVRAQDGSLGSSAGRGVVSFGATGSGERALGALSTSNQINRFGALFMNDTGLTLQEVTIQFYGEQWRRGNVPTADTLTFGYGLTNSIETATTPFAGLSFSSLNLQAAPTEVALDGNDPANRMLIQATIGGVNWTPGSSLAISWTATDLSGQDDGLAIDSLRLSGAVPAPGGLTLLAALAAWPRRRRVR